MKQIIEDTEAPGGGFVGKAVGFVKNNKAKASTIGVIALGVIVLIIAGF